jgi:hypothetical protein
MILAGLDTGTTCGLGVIRGDRLIHAESAHFDGDHPEAFFKLFGWLERVFQRFDIAEMAFEQPLRTNLVATKTETVHDDAGEHTKKVKVPVGDMATFLKLYGIRGVVLLVLQRERVRRRALGGEFTFREINNRSWRSKVYGKCSPPPNTSNTTAWWKEKALEHCRLLGWQVTQKDAAEGSMIAEYLRIVRKEEKLGIKSRPGEPDLFEPPSTRGEFPF